MSSPRSLRKARSDRGKLADKKQAKVGPPAPDHAARYLVEFDGSDAYWRVRSADGNVIYRGLDPDAAARLADLANHVHRVLETYPGGDEAWASRIRVGLALVQSLGGSTDLLSIIPLSERMPPESERPSS